MSKSHFKYPFSSEEPYIWNLPSYIRIGNSIGKFLPKKGKKRDKNVKIWLANNKQNTPLKETDFPLIFIVHNGRRFLPSFLAHYRNLGVTRFVCVDDASVDETKEYLLKQPDVDIHLSNVRFKTAARGKTWRELLAAKYGKNRWYLNVDVDEYLFTGCNKKMNIRNYAKKLYSNGIYRLPAAMIDMIPRDTSDPAILSDDKMPWEICKFFDLSGYSGYVTRGGIKLYGGPRKRLWNADAELIKYPLIYWDEHTSLGVSIHSPWPVYQNHAPICGVLLHFKIFSDVKTVTQETLQSAQYFDNNREYKLMYEFFSSNQSLKLTDEKSIYFEGEETLIENRMVKIA